MRLVPKHAFHGSKKTALTLMDSRNHGLLSPGAVRCEIQQGHGASKDQGNSVSRRVSNERIRSVGRISNRSEKNEKILYLEICRKNSLLQRGEGGYRKGLIADFCHDKTLFKNG